MEQVKITSDGSSVGTYVSINNKRLPGVTRIAIDEVEPGDMVTATITLQHVSLEMLAEAEILIKGVDEQPDDSEEPF